MPVTEFYATGRRKTSSARVFLRPGKGEVTVNHREFEAFFPTEALRAQIKTRSTHQTAEQFDVVATVAGGGINGQAGLCASESRARSWSTTPSCARP